MSRIGKLTMQGEASRRLARRREGTWKPWDLYKWFEITINAPPGMRGLFKRRKKSSTWWSRFWAVVKQRFSLSYFREKRATIKREKQLSKMRRDNMVRSAHLNYLNKSKTRRHTQHKG